MFVWRAKHKHLFSIRSCILFPSIPLNVLVCLHFSQYFIVPECFYLTPLSIFRLRRGDQILAVNDTDISRATHEEAARVSLGSIPALIISPFTPLSPLAPPPVTELKKCPEHLRHSSLITSHSPWLFWLSHRKMWRHSDLINNNAYPTIVHVGENTFVNSCHCHKTIRAWL